MSKDTQGPQEPNIYYEESPGPGGIRPHFHNTQQILFVREGAVDVIINQKEYHGSRDSIFFISNLESHSIRIQKHPYKRYVLSIPSDFSLFTLRESLFYGILLQRPDHFSHMLRLSDKAGAQTAAIFEEMRRECESRRPGWQVMTACLIARLLVELYRFCPSAFPKTPVSGIAGIVLQIQKQIAESFDKELSLENFAEKHFVSKYHLSRQFKRISGYHFREYLILQRISAAKDLLTHTNIPVAEVSSRCGYPNVNHFIRIFKNTVGTTPYQYRKHP